MIDDLQKTYVIYNHESEARSNMVYKNKNVIVIKLPYPTKQLEIKRLKNLSNTEKAIEQLPNITHKAKVS